MNGIYLCMDGCRHYTCSYIYTEACMTIYRYTYTISIVHIPHTSILWRNDDLTLPTILDFWVSRYSYPYPACSTLWNRRTHLPSGESSSCQSIMLVRIDIILHLDTSTGLYDPYSWYSIRIMCSRYKYRGGRPDKILVDDSYIFCIMSNSI